MKATVEKIEKNYITLEIEVEAPQVDEALHRAYRKLVHRVNIPGFRRGKAPRRVLENFIGKAPLYDEALDFLLPQAYKHAVESTAIEPIDRPEVEVVQLEEGRPLIFKARVEVKPEVNLPEYRGMEVVKKKIPVTDADVENALKAIQERHARLVSVEDGEVVAGDLVTVDFQGYLDGEARPDLRAEGYTYEVGSGRMPEEWEKGLLGVKLGEERDIKIAYPSDHPEQQLAGEEVTFHVAVKEIKRKEVSPLDDEFARDVSEFDTLEELKEDLRSKLEEDAARRAEAEVRRQAISFVVDKSEVEIPEVLVERQIDSYIEDLKRRAEANRVYLDEYLERRGTTLEALREEFRPEAERRVKTDLVLGAIAKKEGIRVSEEEIEEKIKEMAERYRQQPEVMRKIIESQVGGLESIKDELLISKTIDLLVREARVVEES